MKGYKVKGRFSSSCLFSARTLSSPTSYPSPSALEIYLLSSVFLPHQQQCFCPWDGRPNPTHLNTCSLISQTEKPGRERGRGTVLQICKACVQLRAFALRSSFYLPGILALSSQKACGPASPMAAKFQALPTHALASSYAKLLVHTFMPGHILFWCAHPACHSPSAACLCCHHAGPASWAFFLYRTPRQPLPIFLRDHRLASFNVRGW